MELLGQRETEKYGTDDLASLESYCLALEKEDPFNFIWKQSSNESELIGFIHGAIKNNVSGVIINPAGFTHTSVALLDALSAYKGYVIEVHMTNIHKRESFRQERVTSVAANGLIEGFGKEAYRLGINAMKAYLKREQI